MSIFLRVSGLVVVTAVLAGCATSSRPSPPRAGLPATRSPVPATTAASPAALEQRAQAYAHFSTALVREMNGQAEQAQDEFWLAAKSDPGNEHLVIDLAHRFLQRQQAEKAIELLTQSAAQPEASGQVHGWLGFALAQTGKTNEAVLASRIAIKKAPQFFLGHRTLAQLHLQAGNTREALKVLDEAARLSNTGAAFQIDLAEFMAVTSRSKALSEEEVKPRVIALLDKVAKLNPDEPMLLQKMADTYKSVGELGKATALYEDLLKNHPPSNPAMAPVLREQLIQLYLRSGDKSGATEQLKSILRENPIDARAYYLLGNLASESKEYSEAMGHFRSAILFNPALEPAYYDLAALQITLNQPEEALLTLKKARDQFSANYYIEFYTGLAQSALKRYGEAARSFTSAELLGKSKDSSLLTPGFYFHFGAVCERNADYKEAERHFRKTLELAPDFTEALNYLGYMWAERGVNLEEARSMIEKALKKEPDNAAYLDSMGWVLFRLNRLTEALDFLQQSVEHSEKPDGTLYDHQGDILRALGRQEEARKAWQKALDVEPNEQIRKKLETPAAAPPQL